MESVLTAYKQVDQNLRLLTAIAERSDQGIVVIDLDGCIQFVNDAWIEMHGCNSNDEFIGKQLSIFHSEERMKSDVFPLIEKTKHYGQIESTVEHIKSDGTVFLTQTKMILVEDKSGNANGLVVFADSIQQNTILQEATVENLKRIEQLSDLIIQFQRLFGECVEAGKYLSEHIGELQTNNEVLLQQFSESDPPQRIEEQYSREIVNHI
jgi:PAS domain S-box-containing protein